MINFFATAANDQSVYYLGQIFGLVGPVLPVKNPTLILGILFKILNTVALSIGAVMVVYTTIAGVIKTATEGEFLGKQWSSLWIPLRTVVGIAALFPTATGYSAIQIVIMWIIMQSIGAADTLWTAVLQYTNIVGLPYTTTQQAGGGVGVKNTINNLFQGLVCQASAKASYAPLEQIAGDSSGVGSGYIQYYCGPGVAGAHAPTLCNISDPPDATCTCNPVIPQNPAGCVPPTSSENRAATDRFCLLNNNDMLNIKGPQSNGRSTYSMGPGVIAGDNGACGTMSYCDTSTDPKNPNAQCKDQTSVACGVCKAQNGVLQEIVSTLGLVANALVAADYSYVQFHETPLSKEMGLQATQKWIQDYCDARKIDNCCVVPLTSSGVCSGNFPNDVINIKNNKQNYNADADAIYNLYYLNNLKIDVGSGDFTGAAANEYSAYLTSAISGALADKIAAAGAKNLNGWQANAQPLGWILAGAYYFKIARASGGELQGLNPGFAVSNPTSLSKQNKNLTAYTNLKSYRNNYNATGVLLQRISNANTPVSNLNTPPDAEKVNALVGAISGSLLESLMSCIQNAGSSDDPLIKLSTFGYQMMILAQVMFVTLLGIGMLAAAVLAFDSIIALGTGVPTSAGNEALKAGLAMLTPFIIALVGAIFGLGATMGIYIPLIPYVIFAMGAIGWFIQCIEAMTAAPFIALGIISPGGQHEIMGRAEPAIMLTLNLFLRPSLMIIGYMIAMLLSATVLNMINAGFLAVVQTVMQAPGLFEEVLFIAVYVSLITTALNKTFSLITHLPDKVLTWIGGQAGAVPDGGQEALGAMKSNIDAVAKEVTSAGAETTRAGMAGAANIGEALGRESLEDAKTAEAAGVTAKLNAMPPAERLVEAKKQEQEAEKGLNDANAEVARVQNNPRLRGEAYSKQASASKRLDEAKKRTADAQKANDATKLPGGGA